MLELVLDLSTETLFSDLFVKFNVFLNISSINLFLSNLFLFIVCFSEISPDVKIWSGLGLSRAYSLNLIKYIS